LPDRVQAIADALALSIEQVNVAFAYYEGDREQIDAWIAENAHLAKTRAVARDAHDWSRDHGPEPASTLAPRSPCAVAARQRADAGSARLSHQAIAEVAIGARSCAWLRWKR